MRDQYKIVTDRIVTMLESGVRPWCKPWIDGQPVTGALQRPLRVTGEAYTGINVINLWCAAQARGFTSRHWMTFNAAKEMGASVKKGAKAELAFYVGRHTVTDEKNGEETEREISFLRAYHVFNADEIEGLPERFRPAEAAPVTEPAGVPQPALPANCLRAAAFCKATGAMVTCGGDRAFYMPSTDSIRMPLIAQFREPSLYYATLLHELAHWTGAPSRCARDLSGRFGNEAYAAEELVAELASAFLCADLALDAEPREDHAAYIKSWIAVLKNDNRAIFKAATLAEAGARYLHARQPTESVIAEPTAPVEAPTPAAAVTPASAAPEPVAAVPTPKKRQPARAREGAASYRESADFLPALTQARMRANADVDGWRGTPAAIVWARVPAAWVRIKIFNRTIKGVRDIALPAARYWPTGTLPIGPDYAAPAPARLPYPTTATPANLALWARSHGLVMHDGVYVSEQEARVALAHRAQNAANKALAEAA